MCRTVQKQQKEEVLINGRVYDVTNFRRKHPGGGIYKFYVDDKFFPDASDAFNKFHMRSEKAKKMLSRWPSREMTEEERRNQVPESDKETALMKDFHALEQEFRDEGLYEPSISHSVYRIAEILVMHVVGIKLMYAGYLAPAFVLLGIACGRCGWWMHELGHHATGWGQKADIYAHEFFYAFGWRYVGCILAQPAQQASRHTAETRA